MMSYEPFDACTTAFVSYTTVHSNTFPSPPRSPTVTSSSAHYEGQGQGHQHQYEFPADLMTSTASQPPHATVSTSGGAAFFSPKIEPSSVHSPIFMSSSAAASVMTNYGSTPDPSESFVSSDTCPETPDSSVKEEAEGLVNSPDTGSYVCLWMECNEEFVTQKSLVDHINDNHMETKKGCDEFPCLWKVKLVSLENFLFNLPVIANYLTHNKLFCEMDVLSAACLLRLVFQELKLFTQSHRPWTKMLSKDLATTWQIFVIFFRTAPGDPKRSTPSTS